MPTPSFLAVPYRLWMRFSHALGRVMSAIILTLLWVIGFGIYAFILRIIGLFRRPDPSTEWRDAPEQSPESMRHQF